MRNATAYGLSPRLRADVVLNNLVCWAHTTGRIRITSDGTPWRPIVHVQDIARRRVLVPEGGVLKQANHDHRFPVAGWGTGTTNVPTSEPQAMIAA
jgi:nucleoside-diphosphate-sugar epimerase